MIGYELLVSAMGKPTELRFRPMIERPKQTVTVLKFCLATVAIMPTLKSALSSSNHNYQQSRIITNKRNVTTFYHRLN